MSYTEPGSGELDDLDLRTLPERGRPERDRREAEQPAPRLRIASSPTRRLFLGQTSYDFWGRRRIGLLISLTLLLIGGLSLAFRQFNLGIDFEGGVALDIPADELTVEDARSILGDHGIDGSRAKIEERRSSEGEIIKVQIPEQDDDTRDALQDAFAAEAGVEIEAVSVSAVSASWGEQITRKALIALGVFLALFSLVIAIRFEWRMAVAAIVAMLHDVLIAAGVYSLFQFEVTPPTVVAFLMVLSYSLYDTIVVFDRVKENERRIAAAGLGAGDLVNVSTNQVLMRTLNTSISSMMPILSLLLIGSGLLGQSTLREFALALLIGVLLGGYSSIFVATPMVGVFKRKQLPEHEGGLLHDDDLRDIVVRGVGVLSPITTAGRRRPAAQPAAAAAAAAATAHPGRAPSAAQLLTHAPRPRKKKRH